MSLLTRKFSAASRFFLVGESSTTFLPNPILFLWIYVPLPSAHNTTKTNIEEKKTSFAVCVFTSGRFDKKLQNTKEKKDSASFPYSKIPLRDSFDISYLGKTKETRMKKRKLERDEGRTFPCLQLILDSSFFEEGCSLISQRHWIQAVSAVALETRKKSLISHERSKKNVSPLPSTGGLKMRR